MDLSVLLQDNMDSLLAIESLKMNRTNRTRNVAVSRTYLGAMRQEEQFKARIAEAKAFFKHNINLEVE